MKEPTKVDTLKFMSPINQEGSWGQRNLAKRTKSVMDLYLNTDDTGFIEWDIPKLGMTEEIGLVFEIDPKGKRTLVDAQVHLWKTPSADWPWVPGMKPQMPESTAPMTKPTAVVMPRPGTTAMAMASTTPTMEMVLY